MSGHLKKFLTEGCAVLADALPQALNEMHLELMALPVIRKDFTTPEGAILCLEDAFQRRDIEAAVAAKDFKIEARLLLQRTKFRDFITDEAIAGISEVLELSFRQHTTASWPDFTGLESFFPQREPFGDGIVAVTEVCRFPDGLFSRQDILVAESPGGWRVLLPK